MKKTQYKTIKPEDTRSDKIECVIQFVPMVKRNVGIGYLMENEATANDFKKYPIVLDPWINPENF